jgi:hypothetical protein
MGDEAFAFIANRNFFGIVHTDPGTDFYWQFAKELFISMILKMLTIELKLLFRIGSFRIKSFNPMFITPPEAPI